MRRIAYLSMDLPEGFCIYDERSFPHLEAKGIAVDTVPWRSPGVDWRGYELVVIRSTWDYQHHLGDFLAVLETIAAATRLENELELCRWNLRKTYLRELQERGVPVVPTLYGASEPPDDGLFPQLGAEEIVLKPVVSANADSTFRLDRPAFARAAPELRERFAERPWMAQPFMESIAAEGEISTFHFDGQYSHAVLKTPAAGDFRVQEEHGGSIRAIEPEPGLRRAAEAALAALPVVPLYARPDFVRDGDTWRLMELELVEPSLYFSHDEQAPARFAEALARRLG